MFGGRDQSTGQTLRTPVSSSVHGYRSSFTNALRPTNKIAMKEPEFSNITLVLEDRAHT